MASKISISTPASLNPLSLGYVTPPRSQSGPLASFECYPGEGLKVLPTHDANS